MNRSVSPFSDAQLRRTLHRCLLRWYASHKRSLPWRDIDNPYYVLISEFMAQQTQLSRVLAHFPLWLQSFPDIHALASATRRSLLLAWSGMGYNRRALNLHAAAQVVVREHGGRIPTDPEVLETLPGIGRYTAHAIVCFGYGRRVPVVDINIRRVLSRLSGDMQTTDAMLTEKEVWKVAEALLPPRAHYNWNQGLMDLGAAVCTSRNARCGLCPLQRACPSAHRLSTPAIVQHASVRETPRRVYRGRVVELLRGTRGHCSTAAAIASAVFDPTPEDHRLRILDILESLRKDGMVVITHRRTTLTAASSFTGALTALRICLTK
jgi:A/G-specific adenine glycosylase